MKRGPHGWCLAAALCWAVLVSAGVAQEGKQADSKKEAKSKEKLQPAGTWTGKIIKLDKDRKSFTLRVYGRMAYVQARPSVVGTEPIAHVKELQLRYGAKTITQDEKVWIPPEAKIRVPLKPEFDDKGKLKGSAPKKDANDPDPKLPGGKGSPSRLQYDQWVTVVLKRSADGFLLAEIILVHGE